ncbi:MAG: hypothetical protein IPK79_00140 [Vampirovibrionales bacterium]|nr:hypothetical protein [Vampirovibrionales bacterium]
MKWVVYFLLPWTVLVGMVMLFRAYPVETTSVVALIAGTFVLKRWADERVYPEPDTVRLRVYEDGTAIASYEGEMTGDEFESFRRRVAQFVSTAQQPASQNVTPQAMTLSFDQALTVTQLRTLLASWPETDADGLPVEVWIETGVNLFSAVIEVKPLRNGAVLTLAGAAFKEEE